MSKHDKPPKCPFCKETTLDANEYHSGLKTQRKMINGTAFLLVFCANCGSILGITRE